MDGRALLLLLSTQLEVLAATQVLHLEARALLALHLERDLLRHLPVAPDSSGAGKTPHITNQLCKTITLKALWPRW